jgi:GDP-D-mannose dehydratase
MIHIAGVNVEVRISNERLRPVDTPELRGDNGKLTRDTAWEPTIEMKDTLSSLVTHWRGIVSKEH